MKEIISYITKKWFFIIFATILIVANIYAWYPFLNKNLKDINVSASIALILSVISIILTYNNYRYNRRLQAAQRFNYAYEKFLSLSKRHIEFTFSLSCNAEHFEKEAKYYFDIQKEQTRKISEIRNKYFTKLDNITLLNPINIEKSLIEINECSINMDLNETSLSEEIIKIKNKL